MNYEEDIYGKLFPEAAAKLEYIICAAIWYQDGNVYPHQPFNIKSGIVFCGRRHHNCFIPASIAFPQRDKEKIEQGFLTSKDRYVNRREAAVIARNAGQISDETNICLFSEDIY